MECLGLEFAQHLNDAPHGAASDDAVVHEQDLLATEHLPDRVEFQTQRGVSGLLVGHDEGAPHVTVLDEALAVHDA